MSLTFVIPVRHHESVPDWADVQRRLAMTAASVAGQVGGTWKCVVVANRDTPLPPLPDGFEVVLVDLPLRILPGWDGGAGEQARNDAVREDKGARVLAGIVAARPTGHVMVLDYDDFVSRRLVQLTESAPDAPGWVVDSGFVYDEGPLLYLKRRGFNDLCGSSLVVHSRLLGLEAGLETDAGHVARTLGSHVYLAKDLATSGTPLARCPFPGAVYRVAVSGSVSGSAGVRRKFFRRRLLVEHPVTFVRRLGNLVPTRWRRTEFALPTAG
jgi:hypothetical protein